jgi:hypothetical protein
MKKLFYGKTEIVLCKDAKDIVEKSAGAVAEQSKKQLREDPNFKELGYIPAKGITMTIPAHLAAKHCYTMVPLKLKKEILTKLSSTNEPTETLPASILLNKKGVLFVDKNSCPDLWLSRIL